MNVLDGFANILFIVPFRAVVTRQLKRGVRRQSVIGIGDSLVMVSSVGAREAMPAFLYLYVDDIDTTYQRALEAGAVSLEEPRDVPLATVAGWSKTHGATFGRLLHTKRTWARHTNCPAAERIASLTVRQTLAAALRRCRTIHLRPTSQEIFYSVLEEHTDRHVRILVEFVNKDMFKLMEDYLRKQRAKPFAQETFRHRNGKLARRTNKSFDQAKPHLRSVRRMGMNRKLTSRASSALTLPTHPTPSRDCKSFYSVLLCVAIFILLVLPTTALAQHLTGRIKGTVKVTTEATDEPPALLVGARLTLVNRDLTEQFFKVVTDEVGNFIFTDLPAATFVLTVEADGLAPVRREINLASGVGLTIDIVMKATISEAVTIREEEGLLSTAETATNNVVRSQTLTAVPLPAENYQSAPLLTPGVLKGSDGVDHQKGARAGQSAYTVNGVDITDPVTGNLAFDIPLEAAANVRTEENPYSAVFGRLTGGATDLETKGGGNKFKITAARIFPTFRNTFSGAIDSFRPRVTFSGPVARERLFFLQSFEYRFTRTRVPSLAAPGDETTSENFSSFTQLDLNINKTNSGKFVAALFPQKVRFAGLNTFNPQPTTPNTKQRGLLVSISEQAIFHDASFLSSTFSYKTFDFDVFGQGTAPLELLPEGNTGNYFADIRRQSQRFQWREIYYAHGLEFHGQHTLKLGGEIDYSRVTGVFHENSILIRRGDRTLARRVEFGATATFSRSLGEYTAFAQDRWVVNKKLTVDAGLRFDRDGLARQNAISPRLSFLYLPLKNHATVIRGGIGLFYDRTPLSVGYFSQLPERTVTTFAADGISITEGPTRFANISAARLRNPRSVRSSLQIDFPITSRVTGRIGYLQRSTTDDFIVDRLDASGQDALVLSNLGRSRYRELQLLAIYDNPRIGTLNATYVWSKARGDLNSLDNFLGDFPAFVVRPNEYGPQPFDATQRFLVYGQLRMRSDINIAPLVEIRSGFPFSFVNERLDFVGPRNQAGRFPTFLSVALQVTKGFAIPKFVPMIGGRRTRVGAAVLNTTNHFNPSEVQNNITSPRLGQFFNSLGVSVRGKFEFDF